MAMCWEKFDEKLQYSGRLLARAAMIMGMWLPRWCVPVVGCAYYSDGQLSKLRLQTEILKVSSK